MRHGSYVFQRGNESGSESRLSGTVENLGACVRVCGEEMGLPAQVPEQGTVAEGRGVRGGGRGKPHGPFAGFELGGHVLGALTVDAKHKLAVGRVQDLAIARGDLDDGGRAKRPDPPDAPLVALLFAIVERGHLRLLSLYQPSGPRPAGRPLRFPKCNTKVREIFCFRTNSCAWTMDASCRSDACENEEEEEDDELRHLSCDERIVAIKRRARPEISRDGWARRRAHALDLDDRLGPPLNNCARVHAAQILKKSHS